MESLLEQLMTALQPLNLVILLAATVLGILVGVVPGLTVLMALALVVPVTIHLSLPASLALILCIYVSGIYGGSVSAILINTPGTPAAAATMLDGYPLARQGKAGKAMKMALLASILGGLFSIVVLVVAAGQLARFALMFGPTERAALLIFAMTIVGSLAGRSMLKGLLAACLGMLVGTVGADPMLAVPRFTFGLLELEEGFGFIPVMIGLFAVSEILVQAEHRMRGVPHPETASGPVSSSPENNRLRWREIRPSLKTMLRSSVLGTFIGILPGIGATIACFLGYGEARRNAKHPEEFGRGSLEGVAAAEAANNAVSGATLIPLLALSIPGDGATAVLYGVLLMQNVQTGPLIFQYHLDSVHLIYITLILANLCMAGVGLALMPVLKRVADAPRRILFPIILVCCAAGAFAARNSMADVYIAMGFGVAGYLLRKCRVPLAPMLIGFILGPLLEEALRQALLGSAGDLRVFLTRPIAVGFLVLALLSIAVTVRRALRGAVLPREESE